MKDTRHSNERARLRLIRSILLPLEQAPTIVGLAEPDDAAVVATGGAESVILTTDFIRGTEFLLFKAGHGHERPRLARQCRVFGRGGERVSARKRV